MKKTYSFRVPRWVHNMDLPGFLFGCSLVTFAFAIIIRIVRGPE